MNEAQHITIRPQKNSPIKLQDLVDKFLLRHESNVSDIEVSGVTLNSRDVGKGDLYFGIPGAKQHGAQFAKEAKDRGAVAMVTDETGAEIAKDSGLMVLIAKENLRGFLGSLSSAVYRTDQTEMKIFGITGTNGKTSVVYMLDALLRMAGLQTGISTTAERRIGETAIESDLTSPESSELHGLLARMQEESVEAVALEVSAQAVERGRIDGVLFDVVAFNNFSQDHLDEFGSMQNYFAAKLALFSPEHACRAVVVVDTPEGQRIARESKIPVTTLSTEYGQKADWHLAVTRHTIDGVSFVLQGPDDAYFRARVPLFGRFMAENAALAIIMMQEAGVLPDGFAEKLYEQDIDVAIPGRLELISEKSAWPRFYVDYAHTPGSFKSILEGLDEVAEARILFMFGADGDRDTTKRVEMGAIASSGSDVLVICDYHPRFEDPQAIREQLLEGARNVKNGAEVHEIPDPVEAMKFLISEARGHDIIVYAGPGHENFKEIAGNMIPYSARQEVREALREAGLLN